MMMRKGITQVIPFEDECSTLMLSDLRAFIDATAEAPGDSDVTVEQSLRDGVLSDVISVEWSQ
jgi:hypothetical protein